MSLGASGQPLVPRCGGQQPLISWSSPNTLRPEAFLWTLDMLSTDTSDARLLLETRIEFTKIFLLKYFPYIFYIEGFPQLLISIQSIDVGCL